MAHQAAEDESRSPRLSWTSGNEPPAQDDLADGVQRRMQQQQQEQQQEDQLAIAQNGGASSSDEGEDDGDLDDDMMDRISSSPSIDDGAYPAPLALLPRAWPRRVSSLQHLREHSSPTSTTAELSSAEDRSSPYLDVPEHLPLHCTVTQQSHLRRIEHGESEPESNDECVCGTNYEDTYTDDYEGDSIQGGASLRDVGDRMDAPYGMKQQE